MSLIPTFYCDNCGHAFNTPEIKGHGWLRVKGRDEFDSDERCPKCGNPDYELLAEDKTSSEVIS